MEFWNVPVDGSAEMDDSTTESIEPFDYRALTEFNPAYLAGYQTVTVKRRNLSSHGGMAHYALRPVWLFETVYRDKKYQFAINGQTGKMVGELPVAGRLLEISLWIYGGWNGSVFHSGNPVVRRCFVMRQKEWMQRRKRYASVWIGSS